MWAESGGKKGLKCNLKLDYSSICPFIKYLLSPKCQEPRSPNPTARKEKCKPLSTLANSLNLFPNKYANNTKELPLCVQLSAFLPWILLSLADLGG